MKMGLKLGVFLAVLFGSTPILFSEVIFVNGGFSGLNSTGKSWSRAFASIEDALESAKKQKEVCELWIKAGVYHPSGTNRTASFVVPDGVKLYGGFSGSESVRSERNPKAWRTNLSGDIGRAGRTTDNCFHVLRMGEGCVLDGLVISSGNADGEKLEDQFGGAFVLSNQTKVVIQNCTFEKNHAKLGGGALSFSVVMSGVISNCIFYANSAADGGALLFKGEGRTQLTRATFTSNVAKKSGGAIGVEKGAQIKVDQSWFLSNRTLGQGGAIAVWGTENPKTSVSCVHVQFNDNSATQTGGALFCRGFVVLEAVKCQFNRNVSINGAGISVNEEGAVAKILESTFRKNSSAKSSEAIVGATTQEVPSVSPSNVVVAVEAVEKKPVVPTVKRLKNLELYTAKGRAFKTNVLMERAPFSAILVGDLTDSTFISNYARFQALGERYRSQSVKFYFLQSYNLQPENNGYLKPFTLKERLKQIEKAKEVLGTTFPWVCDGMDHPFAKALSLETNNLFVFNNRAEILFAGDVFNFKDFRRALASAAGVPTGRVRRRVFSQIPAKRKIKSSYIKRVFLHESEKFKPLQIIPAGSRRPYFAKLRVEANKKLRTTKNGKILLSFRLDPLYSVKWNNLGSATLQYSIKVPRGCAISPSRDQAKKAKVVADTDPREFLLDVRKWSGKTDLVLTVKYPIILKKPTRTRLIEQQYIIRKKVDPFSGTVIR